MGVGPGGSVTLMVIYITFRMFLTIWIVAIAVVVVFSLGPNYGQGEEAGGGDDQGGSLFEHLVSC